MTENTTTTEAPPYEAIEYQGSATSCPEDNKLRLYVGRVPRDEYEQLRADGWTSTPKQSCDFVATWTPSRRDTALEYAGIIGDEDQEPAARAADRAERFAGYRDKRTTEATGRADSYDAGPRVHGYQSQARAERAAAKHDRFASRAVDSWSKAEYWTQRTAVIDHALYKSTPAVRMGRIKELEAQLRKERASMAEYDELFAAFQKLATIADTEKQTAAARAFLGASHVWAQYIHPRAEAVAAKILAAGGERAAHQAEYHRTSKRSLYSLIDNEWDTITGAEACALFFSNHRAPASENDWTHHLTLRLAYENQMLEAQGGRAAFVEMIPGGFIGKYQIRRVNKSNVTGRVVSVQVKAPAKYSDDGKECLRVINIERLDASAYRAPSDTDIAALAEKIATEKAAAPAKTACPLINPTDADAERLQAIWNAANKEPSQVLRVTQAEYSARSGGNYTPHETVTVTEHGTPDTGRGCRSYDRARCAVFKVRKGPSAGFHSACRVIIVTDKPQKPLPWAALKAAKAAQPSRDSLRPKIGEIQAAIVEATTHYRQLPILEDAAYVGLVEMQSITQVWWTEAGLVEFKKWRAENPVQLETVNA